MIDNQKYNLIHGNCLEILGGVKDESIDLILCDLPYGTTKNKFDTQIDLKQLWEHYKRIIKKRGCIALFAQTPFDKVLGASNLEMLKYEWIWEKPMATGRLNCHFAPMKAHENVLIFSKSAACYVKNPENAMKYFPQMTEGRPYKSISGSVSTNYDTKWAKKTLSINEGTRYPRDVQRVAHDRDKYHPTQKPVELCEYLIKTYTEEGDLVLDNCMGSGTTGVAAMNLGRRFIGIELEEKFFNIAKERIENAGKLS